MTIGHSGDYDARRIGWWARRGAIKQIRSSSLTEADRELRVQQARLAQTRGELAALTRGLGQSRPVAPATPPPWTTPMSLQHAPTQPPTTAPGQHPWPGPSPRTPPSRRRSGCLAAIAALGVAFLVVSGVAVGCVSVLVRSADDLGYGSRGAPIESAEDWTEVIDAFSAEVDMTRVLELVVSGTPSVSVADPDDTTMVLRFFLGRDVTPSAPGLRSPSRREVDVTAIDPDVVVDAVAWARADSGNDPPVREVVRVTDEGAGPQIAVSFPLGAGSGYTYVVDASGRPVSTTP